MCVYPRCFPTLGALPHNYTYTFNQTNEGIVSGLGVTTTPFMTATALISGTVNGDTLTLYIGADCATCTLTPVYRGLVSSTGKQIDGSFLSGGVSPLTLFKQ